MDKNSKKSIIILSNIYSVKNNLNLDEIFNNLKSKVEKMNEYKNLKYLFDIYLTEKEILYLFSSLINTIAIKKQPTFDLLNVPRDNLIKSLKEKLKLKIKREELENIENYIKELENECYFGIFDPQRDKIIKNICLINRNNFTELRKSIKYIRNYKKIFNIKGDIRKYSFDNNKCCLYMKNGDMQFCEIKNNKISKKILYYSSKDDTYIEKDI